MTSQQSDREVRRGLALGTVLIVLFLTFLDNTVVSVTLADVQSDLHAGVSGLQWVVNGYAVFFASLMLFFGAVGDRWGRKRVMLGGVAVFCGGSVVAALATSTGTLVTGRVIMGVGAAASEPGTLSVLRQLYPDRRDRARAVGAWAAVSGLALALGPVVGGTLIGLFTSWRSIFWFNLVFGLVAFAGAAVSVPESADRRAPRLDVGGALLGTTALGAVAYALINGENTGYGTWWTVVLFTVGALAAAGFIQAERVAADPVLDLSFFRRPIFTGSQLIAFLNYFGVFSIFFFVALYLQVISNGNTSSTGYSVALDFVPLAGCMIVASLLTGRWVARSGPKLPMTVGCLLGGTGTLLTVAMLGSHVNHAGLKAVLAVAGVGFGMAVVPVTSATLSVVPRQRSGMAASAANTSRELGAVFGVAVLGGLVNAQLNGYLRTHLPQIGIPANFQSFVIAAVTHGGPTGGIPPSAAQAAAKLGGLPNLITKVEDQAFVAFRVGIRDSLVLSGVLLLVGAVVTAVAVRRGPEQVADDDG